MDLIEIKEVRDWLSQFKEPDVLIAMSMLRSLVLVSHDAFNKGLEELITQICSYGGKVASFPVKRVIQLREPEKEKRQLYQSADAIGYLLTNLERKMPRQLSVEPTHASMKAERVRHIILVDDLLGTGKRVTKFWEQWANKSYKSWLSFKYCQLHVVTYAASKQGINSVLKNIPYLKPENVHTAVSLPEDSPFAEDEFKKIFSYYGEKTSKPAAAFGYGNLLVNVIFQHSCPNNVPAIFWASGKHWSALFPNRSIPASLQKIFSDIHPIKLAESVWDIHQPRLALEMLEHIESGRISKESLELLTVLGLLSRHINQARIYENTLLEKIRVNEIFAALQQMGLVDRYLGLTAFGKDVLARFKVRKKNGYDLVCNEELYYPLQFEGLQRKSSDGPS